MRGVTLPALAAVAPFLTALPAGTPVNVNTAPPEVLAAILRDARRRRGAAIVAERARSVPSTTSPISVRACPQGATLAGDALARCRAATTF